jgi:tetratricopeptide (TPR) repeat protein
MSDSIPPIQPPDRFYVDAALGWLGLRNPAEAEAELSQISPTLQEHPAVLIARWQICAARKNWESALAISRTCFEVAPQLDFGWIHHSYALHELKQTDRAYSFLLDVEKRFPLNPIIPYNLACYCCQLGLVDRAWDYLESAATIAEKSELKKQALADPDLGPLHKELKSW